MLLSRPHTSNFGKLRGIIWALFTGDTECSLWDFWKVFCRNIHVFHESLSLMKKSIWSTIPQCQCEMEFYCFNFLCCSASSLTFRSWIISLPNVLCLMYLCCSALCCCTFLFEWSCHVDLGELMSSTVGEERTWHEGLWRRTEDFFAFFSVSSSVDIGGGLVVVCMTSFTSMFGVTSYVRLLNCYMGHLHSHRLSQVSVLLQVCCIRKVRMICWSNENSCFLQREKAVGGLYLSCDKACGKNLAGKVLKFL